MRDVDSVVIELFSTYVYHDSLTKVVVVRDGLKVGYASELGVGGVPVLFLAAELGQRPERKKFSKNKLPPPTPYSHEHANPCSTSTTPKLPCQQSDQIKTIY